MSLALTTTYENGIYRGVSGPFLRQHPSFTTRSDCIAER
jgi:hypothetical protein